MHSRMSERIEFLSAVLLVSRDAGRLAAFYRDVLGVPLAEEQHNDNQLHWGCTLGDLHFEQLTEERTHIDAGKKIARASRSLGRAGVVTVFRIVQREVHERGHRHGAALAEALANPS